MKAVEFKEQNIVLGEGQDEYLDLPAYKDEDPSMTMIFCWKLSLADRLRVIFSGLIWHRVATFGNPLQPQMLDTEHPFK